MGSDRHFMNPVVGRHLGMASKEAAPGPGEDREETTSLTCPNCGAILTVEAEKPEEERPEAEAASRGGRGEF